MHGHLNVNLSRCRSHERQTILKFISTLVTDIPRTTHLHSIWQHPVAYILFYIKPSFVSSPLNRLNCANNKKEMTQKLPPPHWYPPFPNSENLVFNNCVFRMVAMLIVRSKIKGKVQAVRTYKRGRVRPVGPREWSASCPVFFTPWEGIPAHIK